MRKLAVAAVLLAGVAAVLVLIGQGFPIGQGNWPSRFQSNGERIYFTATSASGDAITRAAAAGKWA